MPKLLLFAPCEKIIIDKDSNTTSLITLLETLNISVKLEEREKIPEDAALPFSWHILALWRRLPEDEGKKWEQRVLLDIPKGIDMVLPIAFEPGKVNWRNVIRVVGLPISPLLGTELVQLKLFLREQGDENPWALVSEYYLVITHPKPV